MHGLQVRAECLGPGSGRGPDRQDQITPTPSSLASARAHTANAPPTPRASSSHGQVSEKRSRVQTNFFNVGPDGNPDPGGGGGGGGGAAAPSWGKRKLTRSWKAMVLEAALQVRTGRGL
jgi:hypothetical protein